MLFVVFALMYIGVYAQSDSIGVYVQKDNTLCSIEPLKSAGYKANTLGTALTMGVANTSMKVLFNGATSKNKVSPNSAFYFYYNTNTSNKPALLMKYYMLLSGGSPESDFSLVKFIQKKNSREIKTGTVNVYSGVRINTGTNTDASFLVEKINDTKYKVTLNNVDPGEYCFMYNGINGSGAYTPVFDFRVE